MKRMEPRVEKLYEDHTEADEIVKGWKETMELVKAGKFHGHPMFYELLQKMAETHSAKNHDYSGDDPLANFRECEAFNVSAFKGILVRLTDKYSRIKNLAAREGFEGDVKDEKIEDTLLDNAVYSLLAIIVLREAERREDMERAARDLREAIHEV